MQTRRDRFIENIRKVFNVSDEFAEACDHKFDCRCDKCLQWWREMGPEEQLDGTLTYGPFTKEEIDGTSSSPSPSPSPSHSVSTD